MRAVVDVEADVVGLPLDGVEVEGGVDGLSCGEVELGCDAFGGAVAGAMQGAVNDGGFADTFDDVDLAAGRPVGGVVIVAEHPECGPDAFAEGKLDAGFEAAVGLGEETFGVGCGRRCSCGRCRRRRCSPLFAR